jgi:hypothetical protein
VRLTDWQARAPHRDAVSDKILAPARDALALLGADRDPDCWIVWGDDPAVRWTILAPTPAGLAQVNVRVNVPGEGPRSAGKLLRWHRVQVGELSAEVQGGHRLLTFQVESMLLKGTDADGDAASAFIARLFAHMDGRATMPPAPNVIELAAPHGEP